MKAFQRSLAYCAILLTAAIVAPPAVATSKETIAMSVGRLLEEGHYTRLKLNGEVSRKFLQTYLELLDYSHLFFTQKDVDEINAKYGDSIAEDVLLGTLKPAYEIYDLYAKRVDDRVAKIKELLKQPLDFKTDVTFELSRQKSPWPKDEAEADQLWRGRITNELLQENLSEHPIEPAPQLVARRYDRLARNVHEQDKDEQVKLFLDALAQTYDPHSEYLSKADMKNFSINMGLSLVGIGAMLRSEDGYAKIESLVPGGPAQADGRLKVGDRITAVAQGPAEFVDVREMRLDKVVEMIRGKKGTHVRLLVIPSDATDPSRRKNVELVRDEIKLKDQAAEERKHRRVGCRSSAKWRRLTGGSAFTHWSVFEIGPDRSDKRLQWKYQDIVRSRLRHRLFRTAGGLDQSAKRVRQRDFCGRSAGLRARRDCRRQKYVRKRNSPDDSPNRPVRVAAWQSFRRGWRIEINHPEILSRRWRLDAAPRCGL